MKNRYLLVGLICFISVFGFVGLVKAETVCTLNGYTSATIPPYYTVGTEDTVTFSCSGVVDPVDCGEGHNEECSYMQFFLTSQDAYCSVPVPIDSSFLFSDSFDSLDGGELMVAWETNSIELYFQDTDDIYNHYCFTGNYSTTSYPVTPFSLILGSFGSYTPDDLDTSLGTIAVNATDRIKYLIGESGGILIAVGVFVILLWFVIRVARRVFGR